MITSILLLPALLGFAGERVEVTRWRGLIAAGFVAVALFGIGIGAPALTAVGAGLAALTLLVSFAVRPLRQTVPHRAPKPVRETLAYRWSRTIQRRPWLWVVAGTLFLLTLAAPVLGLRLGFSDEGNLAEDTYTRQAYDLLADGFGPGFNGPFIITVVPGDGDSIAAVDTLQQALAETPGVAAVTPAFPNRADRPRGLPHQPGPDDRTPGRRHHRTGHHPARRRHPRRRSPAPRSTSRSPGPPPPTSTSPTSSPAASPSSSPPCWRCRSSS